MCWSRNMAIACTRYARPSGNLRSRRGGAGSRATLTDWVGRTSRLFEPLVQALRRHVMSCAKLHADDTPVPVLAPGLGKTKTGRLWTYVRDDRYGRRIQTLPSGMVRLFSGSQGRTSAGTSAPIHGNTAGGWLRWVRSDLRSGTDRGSRVLGARAQEVLRSTGGAQISRRSGSARADRSTCMPSRNRSRDARRKNAGRSATPGAGRCWYL